MKTCSKPGGSSQLAKQIVSRHFAVFTTPPAQTPHDTSVDGPLLGNGFIGVAMGGTPELQRMFLSRNDFWRMKGGYGSSAKAVGSIDLHAPALKGAEYRVEQKLWDAVTESSFLTAGQGLTMQSWVAATADVFVIEFSAVGRAIDMEAKLVPASEETADVETGTTSRVNWFVKQYARDVRTPTAVACAVKIGGSNRLAFRVSPGRKVTLVAVLRGMCKSGTFREDAVALAEKLDAAGLRALRKEHAAWWRKFWEQAWVELDDPVIEQRYYLSHYVMGSSCRDREFPPPIFGTWVTTNAPWWSGDYHLNYNFQAPFYGLYSSNRIEQASAFHAPILDFMERGRWYAKKAWNCRGVHYPVGIGPKGDETTLGWPQDGYCNPAQYEEGGVFYGQKSNAAYCVTNMALHWYHTYDESYAAEVYPFIRAVADFWEDYLKFEPSGKGGGGEGRYVIHDDSIHEGSGKDLNPILSLGLVRMVFKLALDISRTTGVDADRREKWQHILDHMSGYPTFERNGRTIFRLSERGMEWCDGNTLGIQHIYPAGGIGLDSDPGLLQIARDTIEALGRWRDGNGMSSLFPASVRVGYDARIILRELRDMILAIGRANGFIKENPHGVENCSTVPNTINEMLVQGHEGILRFFPAWPRERDASFGNLRAEGEFLVSAELRDGIVGPVTIRSEKGRPCKAQNPWPGRPVRVFRNGKPGETVTGPRFEFPTKPDETIVLAPA